MKGQMNIFDFIDKPEEQSAEKMNTIPRQLLYIIDNPVIKCANCVCRYCANNAEELWDKVQPLEVKESCLNCDKCHEFTGDRKHKTEVKKYCDRFVLSNYGAAKNRKRIKLRI